VLAGNLFGVAAAEGESVEIATVGIYELPKLQCHKSGRKLKASGYL
jgi:predicted RecA/RadA family phage recombinase